MSHLAEAGEVTPRAGKVPKPPEAGNVPNKQIEKFNEICAIFPETPTSLGASSTVFLDKDSHKDTVCIGGVLHGLAPFDVGDNPLMSILTFKTKIGQIREVEGSDKIGYGLNFTAGKKMTIATVPVGFADGMPRTLNGNRPGDPAERPYVLVAGVKAYLVGTTSMD